MGVGIGVAVGVGVGVCAWVGTGAGVGVGVGVSEGFGVGSGPGSGAGGGIVAEAGAEADAGTAAGVGPGAAVAASSRAKAAAGSGVGAAIACPIRGIGGKDRAAAGTGVSRRRDAGVGMGEGISAIGGMAPMLSGGAGVTATNSKLRSDGKESCLWRSCVPPESSRPGTATEPQPATRATTMIQGTNLNIMEQYPPGRVIIPRQSLAQGRVLHKSWYPSVATLLQNDA